MFEDNKIEFKQQYTSELKKEVTAFANTDGGVIYVGRDDKGNNYPIQDIDKTLTQITNSIREEILPDVTMFVDYKIDKDNIIITVQEGTNKPYFLAEKGLKPTGVYVRQGTSSVPASFEQIRKMIKQTDEDKFETTRSLIQKLTFNTITEEFAQHNMEFGEKQKRTLSIICTDGLYTNLGVLLSDQCTHTIKFAVFMGTKKGEFKTRKETGGSVLKQMHTAFDFLNLYNNLSATFSGLNRIEQYDYPIEAIREATLNALIHRDYSFSGSTIINIYDDRMEFVTLGGLVPGLQIEDLFMGISQPRNEKLAHIFYRLKYIEAYGTGLRRIMQHYENFEVKPKISTTQAAFVLTLPNMNYIQKPNPLHSEENTTTIPYNNQTQYNITTSPSEFDTNNKNTTRQTVQHQKIQHKTIIEYLQTNQSITNKTIQTLLQVKQTRAYIIIQEMVKAGLIIKQGSRKTDKEYSLTKQNSY
ncbi:MAG: putative DNA binding domain-containing protein [Nitrososphaerota archaeon]|jgi:ATP-dependent DNA helicase RecG|nr:putative DNA binding domain-containing protein [Nitrososphaerota archaeon]